MYRSLCTGESAVAIFPGQSGFTMYMNQAVPIPPAPIRMETSIMVHFKTLGLDSNFVAFTEHMGHEAVEAVRAMQHLRHADKTGDYREHCKNNKGYQYVFG